MLMTVVIVQSVKRLLGTRPVSFRALPPQTLLRAQMVTSISTSFMGLDG